MTDLDAKGLEAARAAYDVARMEWERPLMHTNPDPIAAAITAYLSAVSPPDNFAAGPASLNCGEPVAWQWSDFSGKWYTVDTARQTIAEQEELARRAAADHEGRCRPLYAHPASQPVPDNGGWLPIETAKPGRYLLYFPAEAGRNALPEMLKYDRYPVGYPRQPTLWKPIEPPAPSHNEGRE